MENTLVILKPDCIRKKCCGEVIRRLESESLMISRIHGKVLEKALIREHYSHLSQRTFFEELVNFMSSGISIFVEFKGDDAVQKVRKQLGATNCLEAQLGTIRHDLGEKDDLEHTSMYNIAHGSDSLESASIEISRFFD